MLLCWYDKGLWQSYYTLLCYLLIHDSLYHQSLFGKEADNLEQSTESEGTCIFNTCVHVLDMCAVLMYTCACVYTCVYLLVICVRICTHTVHVYTYALTGMVSNE